MKETAAKVGALSTEGSASYFLNNEFVGDSMRLSEAMQSVSRLLNNLGTADKASNFLLEQRKLVHAQANENKLIREMIDSKVSNQKKIINANKAIGCRIVLVISAELNL